MELSKKQIKLITTIQNRLQRGDIKELANRTGYTREYVGKCLSTGSNYYNHSITEAAVRLLSKRDPTAIKHAEILTAR